MGPWVGMPGSDSLVTAPPAARQWVQEARIGYDELAVITCPGDDDILERWVEVMETV